LGKAGLVLNCLQQYSQGKFIFILAYALNPSVRTPYVCGFEIAPGFIEPTGLKAVLKLLGSGCVAKIVGMKIFGLLKSEKVEAERCEIYFTQSKSAKS
jgi:hypothetical protein